MIEFSGGAKLYEQNAAEEVLMGEFLLKGHFGIFRYNNDIDSSSALLLNMASSLISGTDFLGCKVHRKCKVLLVQREQDIAYHWTKEALHAKGISVPVVDTNLLWEDANYEQISDKLIDEISKYCRENKVDVIIIQDDCRMNNEKDVDVINTAKAKFDKLTNSGAAVVYGVGLPWTAGAEKTFARWTISVEQSNFNIGGGRIYELSVDRQFLAMYYRDACGLHTAPRPITEQKYY